MATEVTESQPFKNLKELFDNVGNLKPWPQIKELRDSTDYVYSGLEVSAERMQLEKLDRELQPRTLLCHDMKGGYLEDRFIYGSESYDSYLFYHWSVIDTFVYFSHHFITVPPFGWINAAHNHGVKVLGTVITEKEGIWDVILESQEEIRRFADALILVAKFYKFDGWLLNVENTIKSEQVNNLIYFVKYLTDSIHEAIRNSEIIWYDSVTNEGTLNWQNELNSKNIDFFLNCDGIYLNYNWTKSKLENSSALAKSHNRDIHDIYVGLDIWGRGCPGGGGFNSAYALQKIRHEGLSVAIFGPGWTHEFFGSKTFQEIEDLFWAQLFPYLYVHVPIYEEEVFKTSFCRGSGSSHYRCGQILHTMDEREGQKSEDKPFYNLSLQKPQISVPIPHMKFTSFPQLPESKGENDRNECSKEPIQYVYETKKNVIRVLENVVNIENKMPMLNLNSFEYCSQFSFEGGGCIKLTTKDLKSKIYHRLFLLYIEFEQDIVASIVYKEMESSTGNRSQREPILVLGNNTGLRSIIYYERQDLFSNWKRCVYLTNMRTVNEIGISFARSNVCYLGEIILKQKRRHLNVIMVRRCTKKRVISDNEDSNKDDARCSDDDTPLSERLQKFSEARRWKIPTATRNFQPRVINYVDNKNGVQPASGLSESSCPTSIFEYFFNRELVETIVNKSNRYREKQGFSRLSHDVTISDMYSAIAIIIYMSIVHLPTISMYWNTDPMYNFQFVRKIMPRDKFLRILRFLRFSDEDNNEEGKGQDIDKTYKIQPIIDMLLSRFQSAYRPGRHIVVDESLMLRKDRPPFNQCNPTRRAFGLKTFVLAECETGYVYNLKLYSRQLLRELNCTPLGTSASIVLHLTERLLRQGRTLFLDNYYSSPALYEMLHENGTNVCGTVRLKRKGMPRDRQLVRDINRLGKGKMLIRYNEIMAFCAWRDKRLVSTLTTVHAPLLVRSTASDRVTGQQRKKPNVLLDYDTYAGGVNQVDQIVQGHLSIRKSIKWYKKYFLHLLHITIFNCLVIWNSCHEHRKTFREMKEDIISGLLEKYFTPAENFHRGGKKSAKKLPLRVKSRCFPTKIPPTTKKCHPTKRCVLCKENKLRKETIYFCKNCNVALCIIPCFELFHTTAR